MFLNILAWGIRTNNFQDEHCCRKIQALWQEQEGAVREAFKRLVYAVYRYSCQWLLKETTASLSVVWQMGKSMIFDTPEQMKRRDEKRTKTRCA